MSAFALGKPLYTVQVCRSTTNNVSGLYCGTNEVPWLPVRLHYSCDKIKCYRLRIPVKKLEQYYSQPPQKIDIL